MAQTYWCTFCTLGVSRSNQTCSLDRPWQPHPGEHLVTRPFVSSLPSKAGQGRLPSLRVAPPPHGGSRPRVWNSQLPLDTPIGGHHTWPFGVELWWIRMGPYGRMSETSLLCLAFGLPGPGGGGPWFRCSLVPQALRTEGSPKHAEDQWEEVSLHANELIECERSFFVDFCVTS